MPVAQKFGIEAAHFPITAFMRAGTYAPARFGSAGQRLCGVAQGEHGDTVFGSRKRQFPACHQIEDFRCAPRFDDNGADAGAGKRLRSSSQSRRRMPQSAGFALLGRVSLSQTTAQGRRQFLPVSHDHKEKTFTICSSFARNRTSSQECVGSAGAGISAIRGVGAVQDPRRFGKHC